MSIFKIFARNRFMKGELCRNLLFLQSIIGFFVSSLACILRFQRRLAFRISFLTIDYKMRLDLDRTLDQPHTLIDVTYEIG